MTDFQNFQWTVHSSLIPTPNVEQLRYELVMLRIPFLKSDRRDTLVGKLPLTHVWRGYRGADEIDTRIPLHLWTREWTHAVVKHQLVIAGIPFKSKSKLWDLLPQTHPWKLEAERLAAERMERQIAIDQGL